MSNSAGGRRAAADSSPSNGEKRVTRVLFIEHADAADVLGPELTRDLLDSGLRAHGVRELVFTADGVEPCDAERPDHPS
ncbi:hypothetical protein [Nocardia arthritidis]|uniref:Uncharacterized protein n=1 Tax=Nocardia arthritidis TaxID=228602 RepID=A0A6G9YMK9_9NOCA|nr:hypothetical protein [Nocardia arthritidis]QIS14444.1 hypothetical protein F5544_33035 [Nocardia arthritidis]